jgi:YbbR domain-containing protein
MPSPGVKHTGLKVLSIVLAGLIWLLVSGEQVVERALRVPLEFTNMPAQLELVSEPPDLVDVRVRGSSGALSRVAAGEMVAVLDLRAARSGRRLFHVSAADVRAPFGIEVVQIAPSNISLMFEPSATKLVPVVPEVEGEPREGYEAGTLTAVPATVEVVGPASAIERLTEAMTEPVSIAGAFGTVTEVVNVGVPDPSVRLRVPQSAEVTVTMRPAAAEWAVTALAVGSRSGNTSEITPREVTVYVRGSRTARVFGPDAFEALIDVEELGPGQFQLPVRVVPPPGVVVLRVEPSAVRVVVSQGP